MKEILIQKGKTFALIVRWSTDPIIRKAIEEISIASGAPRLKITGHGIPDGWPGFVTRVQGMKKINAEDIGPDSEDAVAIKVIDADHIELNGVDPIDDNGNEWPAAIPNTGFFVYQTPVDLTGYTARMTVKDKEGGTVKLSTEAAHTPNNVLTATIDAAAKTITLGIDALNTAALAWKKGVADLEMVSATGKVTKLKLCSGPDDEPDPVRVSGEITT